MLRRYYSQGYSVYNSKRPCLVSFFQIEPLFFVIHQYFSRDSVVAIHARTLVGLPNDLKLITRKQNTYSLHVISPISIF